MQRHLTMQLQKCQTMIKSDRNYISKSKSPQVTARGDLTLFLLILQLFQHIKQLRRIRQAQFPRVLQQRNNLIRRIENNRDVPQPRTAANNLNVKHIGDRNNDQHIQPRSLSGICRVGVVVCALCNAVKLLFIGGGH